MAEARRSSILKPPKQRAPLQEVSSLNIHHHDDFPTTTVTQSIMRRVSFAGTSTIKEFDTQAESVLVCHTPAYEESFAISDSSVPSDHSGRFSSRSTISIEDQSTPPALSEDAFRQNVDPADLILRQFGVDPCSQPTKSPPRRPRFSITDEDSPKDTEKPPQVIPSTAFYGKQNPKPRMSVMSPRSPRLSTVNHFTSSPKPIANSPKSQSKRKLIRGPELPSPKNKSPLAKCLLNPNESSSSEMDLTEAISGNIFVNTPSSSVNTQSTPRSVSTPVGSGFSNRIAVGNEATDLTPITKSTPRWKNKTLYDNDMDITRSVPTRILAGNRTELQLSESADGNLHCTMTMEFTRPVNGMAVTNEQHFVTDMNSADGNRSMACVNSIIMDFPHPLESVSATRAEPHEATVYVSEDMEYTNVISGFNLSQCNRSRTELGIPGKPSSTTIYDAVGMDVTEATPCESLITTVCDPEDMQFTKVIPSVPVQKDFSDNDDASHSVPFVVRDLQALNSTVCDPEGMEFTSVIPGMPILEGDIGRKTYREPYDMQNVNQSLNHSVDMEYTEAIPCMTAVRENSISESLPTGAHGVSSKTTLNDSMGMDITEAIPSALLRDISDVAKSPRTESSKKTLNYSTGMDATKAIPSAPVLQNCSFSNTSKICETGSVAQTALCNSMDLGLIRAVPARHCSGFSESIRNAAEFPTTNITVDDSTGIEFTKEGPALHLLNSSEMNETSQSASEQRTSDSMYSTKPLCPVQSEHPPSIDCHAAPTAINMSLKLISELSLQTSIQGSQLVTNPSILQTDFTNRNTLSQPPDDIRTFPSNVTSEPETVSLSTELCTNFNPRIEDLRTSSTVSSSRETSLVTHVSSKISPTKLQLCRKRSFEEIDNDEPEEFVPQKSCLLTTPLAPPPSSPTEVVIPSSRSPSPLEHDSSTRFTGLCQSFSGEVTIGFSSKTSKVGDAISSTKIGCEKVSGTTRVAELVPTDKETNFISPVGSAETSTIVPLCQKQCNTPVNVKPLGNFTTLSNPMDVETESIRTPNYATSEGLLRCFQTPDDYNFAEVSDQIKSTSSARTCGSAESDKPLHKSIMDETIPNILDISDACYDRDLSSRARLYATLLEAENNVSVFHKEQEVEVPTDGELKPCFLQEADMLAGETGKCGGDDVNVGEINMSVCVNKEKRQERKDVSAPEEKKSRDAGISRKNSEEVIENQSIRSLPSRNGIWNKATCLVEKDRSLLNKSSINNKPDTPRAEFTICRPAAEIIKAHRSEYRKRARCNWTAKKLGGKMWCFNYLEDSVELRIKVEELSENGFLSGHDGRFIYLIDDEEHGIWQIGGRLLYQKLSTEDWNSRLEKTSDVLSIVDDVNRAINDVEVFMTELAFLVMAKNIETTHNGIRFDVLSQKTADRWFKVKMDCSDLMNVSPQHVTIENIIGETRETDIQNLVTCVKKNAYFLKNYVAVVEEYLQTIERVG